jgi:hypothetical protein
MVTTGRSTNRAFWAKMTGFALTAALFALGLGMAPASAEGVQMAFLGFGKSADETPKQPRQTPKEPIFCPKITVQPGTAALIIYEKGKEGDPQSVRYQAAFSQFARECVDLGAEIGIRIGIAGRALVGPKGVPGQMVEVPIRFVIQDNNQKVVMSTVTKLQVTIPADQTGITFTHVEDLGTVPFPGKAFRKWDLRVGFDTKPPKAPQG